jgi:hypothetical protein
MRVECPLLLSMNFLIDTRIISLMIECDELQSVRKKKKEQEIDVDDNSPIDCICNTSNNADKYAKHMYAFNKVHYSMDGRMNESIFACTNNNNNSNIQRETIVAH